VSDGIVSLNLSSYSGQITFAQISEPKRKRNVDAESDSECSRCAILGSPEQISTVRKKPRSRNNSPSPCVPTVNRALPRSEELDAVFSEIRKSPGATVFFKYSLDNDKGVFSFLGKNATRTGAVEVSCSSYDPTKQKPDSLVRMMILTNLRGNAV
jgi:hypothetical protein